MENILCEDYSAKRRLVNVKYQFLNVDSKNNKNNMTSLVPSPTELKDFTHTYLNHPNENPSQNYNICHESDEYDSDCSLGSLNSLYLRLKNNSKVLDLNTTGEVSIKQLQPAICNLSKTVDIPENREVPSSKPKNDKHSNDNLVKNDGICHESDEYDSDCSLGSLNSLYLRLNNNSKVIDLSTTDTARTKRLQSTICKTDSFLGNDDAKESNISKKLINYDKTEDKKPIMKLNTTLFYGKQKSSSQHLFTWLSHEYSFKKKFSISKILKTRNSVCKFKYNTYKSQISLKKPKQRRHLTIQKTLSTSEIFWENKYSIRSQLKEPIPLLQFCGKSKKKNIDSLANTTEQLLPNKIKFIKDEHIIKKEENSSLEFSYVGNQLYEPNNIFIDDFMDTDDFGGTKEIENIIQTLFDQDDSFIDNETNKWSINNHYYEDHDEIQDKFFLLFKEFNNFKTV